MSVLHGLLSARRRGLTADELLERYDMNQLQRFEAVLHRHGHSLARAASIMEFGCGEGRLLQQVSSLAPRAQLFGCDVIRESVATCRQRIPGGTFIVNGTEPPLPYADVKIDLIYSYSVFTHLTEANHKAWLAELSRILKPNGVMMHTTHSYEAVRRMAMFSPGNLEKYDLPAPVKQSLSAGDGYRYAVDNPGEPEYGLAVISKEYVTAHWAGYSGLTLLEYVEGAIEAYPEGCQDMVVLEKAST